MILPLFCSAIQGQHYKHPIALQDCNTEMFFNEGEEGFSPTQMALGYCHVCFFVVLESAFSLFSASSSTIWPSIVLTLMGLLFLM